MSHHGKLWQIMTNQHWPIFLDAEDCLVVLSQKYLILYHKLLSVKLMQSQWSLLSPHPPLAFFNLVFVLGLVLITDNFSGKKYFFADLRIDPSLSMTVSESQFDFLWWTPLWIVIRLVERKESLKCYHSPMWKTLGPFAINTCSFSFIQLRDTCWRDQSQL